jgi:hypothetical protein
MRPRRSLLVFLATLAVLMMLAVQRRCSGVQGPGISSSEASPRPAPAQEDRHRPQDAPREEGLGPDLRNTSSSSPNTDPEPGPPPSAGASLSPLGSPALSPPQDAPSPKVIGIGGRSGSLRGVVRLQETPPPPKIQSMTGAPTCRDRHPEGRPDESLQVGQDLGIRNAVVYLTVQQAVGSPPPAVRISIHDCRFTPRVVPFLPLQSLEILNDDDLIHDLIRDGQEAFRLGPGRKTSMRCSGPRGPFRLGCRSHPWEAGWAVVLPNPWFAVTDAEGRFTIQEVPIGEQPLAVWHERFEKLTLRQVQVEAGATAEVEFVLPAPK